MELRKIGKSDLEVYPICFGGNVFGWTIDKKTSFEILDQFIGYGFNFIDTSNNYSHWVKGNHGGESEEIIGQWMQNRKKRHEVIIATKVGGRGVGRPRPINSREHIFSEVEQSLRRLKTDYIDLYQLHYDDKETPIEEVLESFQALIKQGKVRYIGVSNISAERLLESLEISSNKEFPKYQSLQPHYNLYERNQFETEYQKIAIEHELSVLPYYSLASGFLTGKYRTVEDLQQSQRGKDVEKYLNDRGLKILDALDQVSDKHSTSSAAIALAWLLHQKSVLAPIVSATKTSQIQSMIDAPNLKLDQEDIDLLNIE